MAQSSTVISVIIPVYNVERYLCSCVNSVLSQSFSSIEVILVDDGSTDNCPHICDRYAATDPRVRVIHRTNGGLSAARNTGIDAATGEYLTFVDSDDVIHHNCLEILYDLIVSTQTDISSAMLKRISTEPDTNSDISQTHPLIMSGIDALEEMLYQKRIDNSACAKLYHSHLFATTRFPEGIYYEDLATLPVIYHNATSIAHINAPLYYYRRRATSILGSFSIKRADVLDVTDSLEAFTASHCPKLIGSARSRRFSANMNILSLLASSRLHAPQIEERCWENIKALRRSMITDPRVRAKNKLGALIAHLGLPTLKLISRLFVS